MKVSVEGEIRRGFPVHKENYCNSVLGYIFNIYKDRSLVGLCFEFPQNDEVLST